MAVHPAPMGERRGTGWGSGLASTGLVAAEPVLGLSPAHGAAQCRLPSPASWGRCEQPSKGSVRSQLLAHPSTCAMIGEQVGVSHQLIPVCLELVQAQPTSLEG